MMCAHLVEALALDSHELVGAEARRVILWLVAAQSAHLNELHAVDAQI